VKWTSTTSQRHHRHVGLHHGHATIRVCYSGAVQPLPSRPQAGRPRRDLHRRSCSARWLHRKHEGIRLRPSLGGYIHLPRWRAKSARANWWRWS